MNSNKFLYLGVILLIISTGIIVYNLKNSNGSKVFFNISRFLALVSVIGVWYFGNQLTKDTTLEITEARKDSNRALADAEQANLASANANERTKTLDIDLTEAKVKLEEARELSARLNIEAENAKSERLRLEERAKKLEIQEKIIKESQRKISTFTINVLIKLPTHISKVSSRQNEQWFSASDHNQALLTSTSLSKEFGLTKSISTSVQQITENILEIGFGLQPNPDNDLIGNDITVLQDYDILFFATWMYLNLEGSYLDKIDMSQSAIVEINFNINGKSTKFELKNASMKKLFTNGVLFGVPFKNSQKIIVEEHLKSIGF